MASTRQQLLDVRTAVVVVAAVAIGAGLWRSRISDVEFCQRLFQELAIGAPSAARRIDWERLTALSVDVGAAYRGLPTEQERLAYRQAFVTNFAQGFQQTGARFQQFVRWRVERRTPDTVVVGADYPAKGQTLLLSVPAHGTKRLQAIGWKN